MMALPGRLSISTNQLVALMELAEWGARSQADRLLVENTKALLQNAAMRQAAKESQVSNETDIERSTSGAAGAESTGAGERDGGGKGTESCGTRDSVVGGSEQ